ncbi:MAG: glycosyltransferase family 4 protein [Akkermansiaceae bacterium]
MARIRVLMLGWEFPPYINGGLGVACEGLAHALAANTDLSLILPSVGNPYQEGPIRIIPTSRSPHSPVLEAYFDATPGEELYQGDLEQRVMSFAWEALEKSREIHFDVIHAHDWMTAVAGLEIRKQLGKPLIFHVHSLSYDRAGPEEKGRIYDIEKQAIHEADLIIAVSHYTREICINHYKADPEKTTVVYNGITPVQTYRTPKSFPDKLVVFLGRMTKQKGPMHFLKIANAVLSKNPNVRFTMAGTGDQLHALMAESVRLGISDRCHFTGFLEREQIHDLLSKADVYCMPSVSEPFGLSALEAAQFGVPIVISKQSGAAEILPDAEIADALDTEQMAHGILRKLEFGEIDNLLPVRNWEEAANNVLAQYVSLLKHPT